MTDPYISDNLVLPDDPLTDYEREKIQTQQDTNAFQHNRTPTKESNPYGYRMPDYAEVVDREALLKKVKSGRYSTEDIIRLSRLSYLKHQNRYNVRNK
jgi:hypothetical protein